MQAESVARPTRVGLVGLNERARRLLLPGLMAAPRAELAAVCSRDPAKAQQVAGALGPEVRAFGDVGEMLAAGACEAVYVNTPVEAHAEICMAALRAGCAVICEKPLAPAVGEAEQLARAAEQAGVRTAVNFTYRSMSGYRLAERWLAQHDLGRPLHARFELLQGHNFLPGFPHNSALLDSGCHLFDLMAGLLAAAGFGRLAAVAATPLSSDLVEAGGSAERHEGGNGGDGTVRRGGTDYGWVFSARTTAEVGVSALFSRSALGWRNGFRWTLAGDERAIEVELDADRTSARVAERGDGAPQGAWRALSLPQDIAADDARFPAYHLDRLVGAIRGEEPFPSFAEALETNRIAGALAESAQTGRWVPL
jgi:predicted dehydrogenase